MWYIILASIIMLVIIVRIILINKDDGLFETGIMLFFWGCVSGIFLCGLGTFVIPATSGLCSNYAEGERIGYITKISKQGIIWKTYEGQMQIGTGQMAALQQPFDFSVVKPDILEKVNKFVGSDCRVRLKYIEWLLMPYRIGKSDYEIVGIEQF